MQTFTTALTLALATISLAAPTLEKTATGSIILFTEKNFGGANTTVNFNIKGAMCVAATLPANMDSQASSVRLSGAGFNCQLSALQNCDVENTKEATRAFDVDIPDLSAADYHLDNKARSINCGPV